MDNTEIAKSKVHLTTEIIEYVPNAVVNKTILKKSTGNISIMSFDVGEEITEKTMPFDAFIQMVEGSAEIFISGVKNLLQLGEFIVIPAHESFRVKSNGQFKLILTVIKSGYE